VSDFDRLEFRPDDVLRASDLNLILDALRRSMGGLQGGDGVESIRDGRGNTRLAATKRLAFIGKANGAIAAPTGDTPTSGTVTRYRFDGTSLVTLGIDYAVLNASTTKMGSGNGIDSGQRVWVQEDADGNLWVAPLECS
jgi:hypothetical protein